MNLIDALGSLADQRCFILYKLVAKPGTWKLDKVPVSPDTGHNSDAQNPHTLMDAHAALAYATAWGAGTTAGCYGVGIVLHAALGLACVDLDDVLQPDGQWSPLAIKICQRFPGAYIERSLSGRGLHVFFRIRGTPRPHCTKNVLLGIEVYEKSRFIAMGDAVTSTGSMDQDCTEAYDQLLQEHFPPRPISDRNQEWTDKPAPEWSGPPDTPEGDVDLINIGRRLKSPGAIFGGKVSFDDLWTGNAAKLGAAWPSSKGDSWDRSSVDQAFWNHLCYLTGGHADRMLRLSWMCEALVRDKWTHRDDYIRGSILDSCATHKGNYYQGGKQSGTAVAPVGTSPSTAPASEGGRGVVLVSETAKVFSGCVYVQDIHAMVDPDGFLLSKVQFDAHERYGGREYPLTADSNKTTDSAWEAYLQSQFTQFPQVRGTRFDPREPEGAIITVGDSKFVNIWRDPHVVSTPGDASRFVQHLEKLLPHGDDALILKCYLAACVQYRGVKAAWAPFIQGMEGNGKSLIGEQVMRYCLGARYTHKARADKLDGQFNAAFYGKLLVLVDDVKTGRAQWEILKPMITDESMEIEAKGVDKVTREVCYNFIFTANPKDGLKKSATDRRICPLFAAQQYPGDLQRDGMTAHYFGDLFRWLKHGGGNAAVLHYLQTFSIDPRYNFAAGCTTAPATTSTAEALEVGVGAVRQRMQELIDGGDIDGFKGGWVNSVRFNQRLDADSEGKKMSPVERKAMLTAMGYERHPGLSPGKTNQGQVDNKLTDGSKPVLYIKRGDRQASLEGVSVTRAYQEAQSGTPLVPPVPVPVT